MKAVRTNKHVLVISSLITIAIGFSGCNATGGPAGGGIGGVVSSLSGGGSSSNNGGGSPNSQQSLSATAQAALTALNQAPGYQITSNDLDDLQTSGALSAAEIASLRSDLNL